MGRERKENLNERNLGLLTVFFAVALCVGLIIAHGLAPDDFLVDDTTIALVVVALVILLLPQLPTLARYMARLRLPGVEAEFREVADRAAESLDALRVSLKEPSDDGGAKGVSPGRHALSRVLLESDPNFRIAKMAIELERSLLDYARARDVDVERLSLTQIGKLLETRNALTPEQAAVLSDVAQLRNRAVHAARLSPSDALAFETLAAGFLGSLE
ncbi:MAG: hypothetical protein IIA23_04700 [Chloroflexi bacterium]|nr:hypothetical protein [Chloroflexota bacterium]